jgi:hypothetical protein
VYETPGGAFRHFWRHSLGVSFKDRILLANLLQRSRSTCSWGSFLSFFAFKEGILDTQISALGGWPTVSDRFLGHLTTRCGVRRNSLAPKIVRLLPGSDQVATGNRGVSRSHHRKPVSPPLNPMESGQYRHDNNDSRLRQQREPHRIWHRKRHDDIHVGLPQPPLDDRLFNDLHIQL